jgi:hypothetical protein
MSLDDVGNTSFPGSDEGSVDVRCVEYKLCQSGFEDVAEGNCLLFHYF